MKYVNEVAASPIRRRTPPDMRLRTYVVVPLLGIPAYVSGFMAHQYDVSAIAVCVLIIFFMVNHGIDRGYQFAADEGWMYQRPKGWRWFFRRLPWYAIRHEDASRIEAIFGADGVIKSRFMPFEFVLIYGKSGRSGDNIVIYPAAFKDREIKAFLIDFWMRRPELFSEEIVEYIHSDHSI